jgi:sec-independent protein translocase protein TatC
LHPKTVAKYRRYIIVGLFIMGAMLTPPDPYTQIMLAIPLWLLFELGLIVSRMVIKAAPPKPPAG